MNLQSRSYQKEIMDQSDYTYEEFSECLDQINVINRWTQGYQPIISQLNSYYKKGFFSEGKFSLLDVGSGLGDTLREIENWAKVRNLSVKLTGVDLNPWCVDLARQKTNSENIEYIQSNAFDLDPEITGKYDFVVNSLFTHHLNDEEIVELLKWMTRTSVMGWMINDLHRHPVPYYFIKGVTRALDANRLIQNDAPLSVARSFTKSDWKSFINLSGIDSSKVEIKWHWSFRHCVHYSHIL